MAIAAYQDRTAEYRSLIETLKRIGTSAAQHNPQSLNASATSDPQAPSEFNIRACQIGVAIRETDLKISRLAQVAKRSSMFHDAAVEINELTMIIKNDIASLNVSLADIEEIQKIEISNRKYPEDRLVHTTAVCDDLKGKLMAITKRLKEVLTNRNENIKAHESRKQLFSSKPSSFMKHSTAINEPPPWSSSANIPEEASPLLQHHGQGGSQLRRRSAGDGGSYMEMAMLQEDSRQSYSQNRATAMRNVESTISELSGIFTNLASMVVQQGELAIRIDDNMEETLANVDNARSALLTHLNRISSNRWLMIKIFFVLLICIIIFIVFVA